MTATPLRLGLVGHPVAHSLSAVMHRAALEAVGRQGDYALLDTPTEVELADLVGRLRFGHLDGLNVTIPHKQAALGLCDRATAEASALGAVNTLVRSADGLVVGHNTDLPGLVAALRQAFPDPPWVGGVCALLGAGGAARAAAAAALQVGAREVRVYNRTASRARQLTEDLADPRVVPVASALDALAGATLVLQSTSAGMGTQPASPEWEELRVHAMTALAATSAEACVMDLVYRPARTPWCAAAEALGRRAEAGLPMLVEQAALAFALWTGQPAPREVMARAAAGALR